MPIPILSYNIIYFLFFTVFPVLALPRFDGTVAVIVSVGTQRYTLIPNGGTEIVSEYYSRQMEQLEITAARQKAAEAQTGM